MNAPTQQQCCLMARIGEMYTMGNQIPWRGWTARCGVPPSQRESGGFEVWRESVRTVTMSPSSKNQHKRYNEMRTPGRSNVREIGYEL